MTGFGAAAAEGGGLRISCECRSVNGRYLKLSLKLPETLRALEAELEKKVKGRVARGTVNVSIRVERTDLEALVSVNEDVVQAYQSVFARLGLDPSSIPTLPGVLSAQRQAMNAEQRQLVETVVEQALVALVEMRDAEGGALASHLEELLNGIAVERQKVLARAPAVVTEYRDRLAARVNELLDGANTELDEATLAREVAVFASRSDVTEEVERIASHLDQIREHIASGEPAGRTLDFLGQELHREVNTIGSKSSDAELGRSVITLKGLVDRFKEQVANVE